jgi:hypothetical protein
VNQSIRASSTRFCGRFRLCRIPLANWVRAALAGGGAWIGALRRASTALLILCTVLWFLALLMQAGVVRRQDAWAGPFATDAPESPVVVLRMGQSRPLPGLTDTGGDNLENPSRSNIAVTVAGDRWKVGHTPYAELRASKTRAFIHWGDRLHLVLPSGLANGPQLVITADYTLQPRPGVMRSLMLALALLGALRFSIAIVAGRSQDFVRRLKALRRVACISGIGLAAFALTAYAMTILYGWIAGYALPTVALFDVFPAMRRLAAWEPNAPNALFALAGVGAILEWLIRWGESPSTIERPESSGTKRDGRLALVFGAVFLALLFVMSNGGWRGVMSPADMNYVSIAGLLPHSDAADYFFAAADLSVDGRWDAVASQRPIASAIRTGIVAVGGTYVASLVLQAALLAICVAVAILGVTEILGVWSAMAFGGLLLGLERPYVTTTMTETLGLGVVVLSAPFLLRGLRDQSYSSALAAFGLVTAAMLIRMGSMFTLPFLAAWVIFLGIRSGAGRAALAGVALVGAGLWLGQWTLFWLYGDTQLGVGGDFSYVLCGLTTGTDWEHCQLEAARIDISTPSITSIAFARAWHAFLADPTVTARSLVSNAANYIVDLPIILFRQYTNVASLPAGGILLGVTAPILVVATRIKTPFYAGALGFFALIYLTTLASAAIIYPAEGRRVLIVTNVLMSLGLALGFALPGAPRRSAPQAPSRSAPYLVPFVLLLVFGLPALVKARVTYRITSEDYAGDTLRIAAVPVTPAVLVQPSETTADRRQMVVPSEVLRQIGHSVSFDPGLSQALDYAATNAPGTLFAPRPHPLGALYLLFSGPDMLKYPQSDIWIRFRRVNTLLFRIDRWWPDSGQGGAP